MTLMLRIKDEDINTRKKFDEKLLPKNFKTGAMLESSKKDDKAVRTVNLKGKFIKIYVHWNGHPDDCAKDLLKFNTYEKVLNLLLLGDCSCINSSPIGKDGFVDTTSPRRIIKPYIMEPTRANLQEHKTPSFGASDKALSCTEFAYKFVDGKWFVKCTVKGYEYDDWTPLEEHLENSAVTKVHISLDANKGSVADALRELADCIEERDSDKSTEYPIQYASDICVAEINED